MSGPIDVVYCFDDNLALPGAVTILSLLRSNPGAVRIHVLTDPEPGCRSLLEAIARREGGDLRVIDDAPDKHCNFDDQSDYGVASTATYRRIFLPELLPDLERVIYIDADTLVPGSLRELWDTGLAGKAAGAVRDPWMVTSAAIREAFPGGYFNAGVLLADLAAWREHRVVAKALDHIARLKAEAESSGGSALDYRFEQTPLNFALEGDWLEVSARWNCTTMLTPRIARDLGYPDEEFARVLDDPGIVHLLAGHKPWLAGFEGASRWHRLFHSYRQEIEADHDLGDLTWPGAFTNGEQAEIDRRMMALRLVRAARQRGMQRPCVVLTGLLGPEVVHVSREQGFEIDCFITEYTALIGNEVMGVPVIGFAEAFASGRRQVILSDYRRLDRTRAVIEEEAAKLGARPEFLDLTML